MAKSLCLANRHMLIALDSFAQVYDFYYPHIGLENHTMGNLVHKLGVWVDNRFSWFDDGTWKIDIEYKNNTMISSIWAENQNLNLKLHFEDAVSINDNILVRRVEVHNLDSSNRLIKVFFNHQFEIYESFRGDTALFNHDKNVLIHYKGNRYFLMNAHHDEEGFDDHSVGLLGIEGREGTYKDAEDGVLSKNNVEHGLVDSVMSVHLDVNGNSFKTFDYWMCAGESMKEIMELNQKVLNNHTPQKILKNAFNYWNAWINKQEFDFENIKPEYINLFKNSLLVVRSHADQNGAIIASGDTHLLKSGRGTYSYVWPRDGALIVMAMNKAGYHSLTKQFLEFCNQVITKEGYLLHKYRADSTVGSSWHPWVREGKSELPIQEDETALVLIALWEYYEVTKDLEFVSGVYDSLIVKPAEWMMSYIEITTGLPRPTYDLWEEKFGVSSFTSGTVFAGLKAASNFAEIFGDENLKIRSTNVATQVQEKMIEHLFDPSIGFFVKHLNTRENRFEYDRTIDSSSLYSIIRFGVLPLDDDRLITGVKVLEEKLSVKTSVGGICRYENDYYFRASMDTPGNPWIITSLWLAKYYIWAAKTVEDLNKAYYWLDWVLARAQKSGILSEQIHPHTGKQISATPLIWSHAEYIDTIIELVIKKQELQGTFPQNCKVHKFPKVSL